MPPEIHDIANPVLYTHAKVDAVEIRMESCPGRLCSKDLPDRVDSEGGEIQSNSRCDNLLDGVRRLSLGSPELLGRQLRHSHSSKHLDCVLLLTVGDRGEGWRKLSWSGSRRRCCWSGCRSNDACDERFCWMADKVLGESFDKTGEKPIRLGQRTRATEAGFLGAGPRYQ